MTGTSLQSWLRGAPPSRSPRGGPRVASRIDLRGVAPAQRGGAHSRGVDPRPALRGAALSANSRYVIEDLVTNTLENAPQMLDTPTSNRSGLRARLVGGSGIRQQNITERRQMFNSDTPPSLPSDEQQLWFKIETEAAEAEVRA